MKQALEAGFGLDVRSLFLLRVFLGVTGTQPFGFGTVMIDKDVEKVEAATDKAGSFRLKTAGSGKCTLTVTYKKQSPSVDVVVFERPTKYRFIVEEAAGKLVLKRV